MKNNEIQFCDLADYNDSNSCVVVALLFDDSQVEDFDKFLSEELGFSKGKHIIGYHHLSDNVLGDEGRSDYLFEFDHPEIPFNPIARLRFPDIKWTSDFIDNYRQDYRTR